MKLTDYIEEPNTLAQNMFMKSVEKDLQKPIVNKLLAKTLLKMTKIGYKLTPKGVELLEKELGIK